MQHWLRTAFAASLCLLSVGLAGHAVAQADPPARVGRISYLTGTVSYHDNDDQGWSRATLNYPFSSGDALWTEPSGRAEMVVAGARVRLQGATEIEALALDDEQFRLRQPQGRSDLRLMGVPSDRPYEILTPRGTVRLVQDGDYVIEAGTTEDPTRIGVRAGMAQFIDAKGSVLEVHAGEIGLVTGMSPVVFSTERLAPPPMPPEWAARDRLIVYRPAPQYIAASVTGYEDLDAYGSWVAGGDYGQIWVPRAVPAGWAPYRYGHWAWVRPWGWTWIDDAPWGFAPFHYGRWVMFNNRWSWVPPARTVRPVYAPAVVGFVGGSFAELAVMGGNRGPAVGWFPLGPREVYVPPYTTNRTYIRNINVTNVYNVTDIERRADYVERWKDRREDRRDGERWTYANQRYATVVPADAFARSQQVNRTTVRVQADKMARAEVAPVAAPPAVMERRMPDARPGAKAPEPKAPPPMAPPEARTSFGGMPTIGKPTRIERTPAPGPSLAHGRPDAPPALPPAAEPKRDDRPPPTGAMPPAKGPGAPPRPDEKMPPPGARPDLPSLRERPSGPQAPGPQATPQAPARPPAVPPAPATPPKQPVRVGPPPVRERDQAAPPPAPPPSVAPRPPERVSPPPAPPKP
ncbi:DUF6600 domain-containing protein, partial [Vineibacter terrae]|uniref:DUF6600 domain-containing protein n=1 Tax=Vineibacter terrae TaxID=2586908 RepID=UPI002E309B7F